MNVQSTGEIEMSVYSSFTGNNDNNDDHDDNSSNEL